MAFAEVSFVGHSCLVNDLNSFKKCFRVVRLLICNAGEVRKRIECHKASKMSKCYMEKDQNYPRLTEWYGFTPSIC